MPDAEDKEKAEKLAAAKKRYEQLKKQKGRKGPTKAGATETAAPELEEKPKDEASASSDKVVEDASEEPTPTASSKPSESPPTHGRGPSISLQSKMRSESFRKSSGPLSPSIKSPTLPSIGSDGDSLPEICRKQAQRIEELEKHNKSLLEDLGQLEAELDSEPGRKNDAALEENHQQISDLEETLKSLVSCLQAPHTGSPSLTHFSPERRARISEASERAATKCCITAPPLNFKSRDRQCECRPRSPTRFQIQYHRISRARTLKTPQPAHHLPILQRRVRLANCSLGKST